MSTIQVTDSTYHVRIPEYTLGVEPPTANTPKLREALVGDLAASRTLLMAEAEAVLPADTNNWDTVYAIKFPDVNAALRKPGACPTSFGPVTEGGASASGTFGPWQLSGGDGALLHMTVPIPTGSAAYDGHTYPMNGSVATIEIELNFLPQPAPPGGATGQLKDLKAKTQRDAASTDPVVSVTNFTISPDPGFIVKAVMGGLLASWFNANLQQFNHVFSTVDLNMVADKADFQWLKPTTTSYAVYKKDDNPDDSIFGILSMTEDRPVSGAHQISPNAIPAGARSGFLVAPERFLEKLVLPGIPTLFQNAKSSDFEMTNAGTQITNKGKLSLEQIEINGTHYTPTIDPGNISVTLEATDIVFELKKVYVAFSPGIDIYMYYTGYSSVELVTKSDNTKALNYRTARDPVVDHNVEVAAWVTWTEVAASVLAALATLGFGAWAKKAIERITLRVVAIVIALLVSELIANIAAIVQAVAQGNKDALPSVDLVMTNATNAVRWPGSTGWTPTSATLNGSLQFGGDPHFVTA